MRLSHVIAGVVVVLVTAVLTRELAAAIERRSANDRIAAFIHVMPGCFVYRHIDRPDSAYFEVGCRKPMPDTITFVPWKAP